MTDTAIRFVKRESAYKFTNALRQMYPRLSLKYYNCKIPFAPALQSPTIISEATSPESANLIVVSFAGKKAMDIMLAGGMKGVFVQFSPDLDRENALAIKSMGEGIVESYTKSAGLNRAIHSGTYTSMKIAGALIFLTLGVTLLFAGSPIVGIAVIIMAIASLIISLIRKN